MSDIIIQKQELRTQMLQLRDDIAEILRKEKSQQISEHIIEYIKSERIETVHAYLPIRSEVDILPVLKFCLEDGIRVICPKTMPRGILEHYPLTDLDMVDTGIYGTKHPRSTQAYIGTYDLILVPGVAYDNDGYRLGYGGGYYDRFLMHHPTAIHAGVLYPIQQVSQVPREDHDRSMDVLFSLSN